MIVVLVLLVVAALAWQRLTRTRSGCGGTAVTVLAFLLIGYGIVSVPWLIVPGAIALAALALLARKRRQADERHDRG